MSFAFAIPHLPDPVTMTFEFVIPHLPDPVTMTVKAPDLCTAYVLAHRGLATIQPLLGVADLDGLPMLLIAPLQPPIVTRLRPSASHRRSAA